MITTCAFVEWPSDLRPAGEQWDAICRDVRAARPDILVTNELPFGAWLAASPVFDAAAAHDSIAVHAVGVQALKALNVPAVISSRPRWMDDKLVNEAISIVGEQVTPLHQKHFFPNEPGWHETKWFHSGASGFDTFMMNDLQVGVLLCTELMFNEYARAYGRAGADLIVVPRATGLSQEKWLVAGGMAAIVSGSYVVSSNRVGSASDGPTFGGLGLAFSPEGTLVARTSVERSLAVVEISTEISRQQKAEYPCYVAE